MMKLGVKPNNIKRVYVSIRGDQKNIKNFCPKPPIQPGRFLRKITDNSRSHTPEQNSSRPASLNPKMPNRRSLSPYTQPLTENFSHPKEAESMISISTIDKEDSSCMPYELDSKPAKTRNTKPASKSVPKNIDLTPGIFSEKQIVSQSLLSQKKEASRLFASSAFHIDECTTVASRTPSPICLSRNSKCSVLSRNFKINKQHFANEVEKQSKSSKEPEFDSSWMNILTELENLMQSKDFTNEQGSRNKRVPIKLIRKSKF